MGVGRSKISLNVCIDSIDETNSRVVAGDFHRWKFLQNDHFPSSFKFNEVVYLYYIRIGNDFKIVMCIYAASRNIVEVKIMIFTVDLDKIKTNISAKSIS